MNDGKLVPGLNGTITAQAALARVLRVRMAAAKKRAQDLSGEPESIHQLRVATRRATAALRLAKDDVPTRRRQRATDVLRRLRRTAGKVRDIDIFLAAIHGATISDSAKSFLAGHIAYSRVLNFESLQAAVQDSRPLLAKLATSLPRSVDAGGDERFAVIHTRHCRRLLREFDQTLAEAGNNASPEHLHALRIQAKRLRYAMELTSANQPRLASVVVQIENLQEILGSWRDAHAVLERLDLARVAASAVNGAAGSPVAKGIDGLNRQYQRVREQQFAAYRRWVKAWLAFRKRNTPKVLFPK